MQRITELPPLPDRPADAHKGLFGRVLVVGGSAEMVGAPVLAGTAALRCGSGLVYLNVPRANLAASLSITPELIGTLNLRKSAETVDAMVLGPGMGKSPESITRIKLVLRMEKAMVIDADGLNYLSSLKKWPRDLKAKAVLTPHPGEMARLGKLIGVKEVPSDDRGRIELAMRAASEFGQVVVLKGNRSVVSDGFRVYVNRTGDSTLSKGGSGDVLSGIIASLIGQRMERFEAAVAGCWLLGRAGEIAGEKFGRRCAMARDVIDAIPAAIMAYEKIA